MATAIQNRVFPERLFCNRDMKVAESFTLFSGRVAVFSSRSPSKTGANEDAAAVLPYGRDGCVLVVADGVGGERAGSTAARLALESLARSVERCERSGIAPRTAILDGIEGANEVVGGLGSGAATTIAVLEIQGRAVRPYHVGDSVILVAGQRGRIKHQNVAHGPVGYAVEAGLLDEGQAMHHEARNVVSNVVGSPEMRIEVGPSLELAPRDTVVLASDGLSDNMFLEEIVDRVRKGPLQAAAGALASTCRQRMLEPASGQPSKADDLTFVVYRPQA